MAEASLYTQVNTDKKIIQSFYARGQIRCIVEVISFVTGYTANTSMNIGGIKFPKGAVFHRADLVAGGKTALFTAQATTFKLGTSADDVFFAQGASAATFGALRTYASIYGTTGIMTPVSADTQMVLEWNVGVSAQTGTQEKRLICAVYYVMD